MATPRVGQTATRLLNGKVLVVGGTQSLAIPYGALATAELYDPVTKTWSPAQSMKYARYDHTATLLESGPDTGKVLVSQK